MLLAPLHENACRLECHATVLRADRLFTYSPSTAESSILESWGQQMKINYFRLKGLPNIQLWLKGLLNSSLYRFRVYINGLPNSLLNQSDFTICLYSTLPPSRNSLEFATTFLVPFATQQHWMLDILVLLPVT